MDTLPPVGDLPGPGVDASVDLEPRPGMVLAERYVLEEPLGRGAWGWVWKARHTIIGKPFAIKLLAPRTGSFDDEAAVRMLREANALSSLDHPNVIAVTDFGHAPAGTPFIVMELLEGRSLRQVLGERRLSWREARAWARQFLDGVEAAHRAGIVHRDLKPANVFVCRTSSGEPRLKVLDFGVARSPVRKAGEGRLTAAGSLQGTPATMSPEQIAGEEVDTRSDLYSIGCVLFEMLAGTPAISGEPAEILYQHVYGDPPSLREHVGDEVPEAVTDIVRRCLAKSPEDRPSIAEVRDAFERRGAPRPTPKKTSDPEVARRWWPRLGALAGFAGVGLVVLVAAKPAPPPAMAPVEVSVPAVGAPMPAAPSLQAELPVLERVDGKPRVVAAPPPERRRPRKPRSASKPAASSPTPQPKPKPQASEEPPRRAPEQIDKLGLKNPFSGLP